MKKYLKIAVSIIVALISIGSIILTISDNEFDKTVILGFNDEYGNKLIKLKTEQFCEKFQVKIYSTDKGKEIPLIVKKKSDGWQYIKGVPAQSYYAVDCDEWERFAFVHLAIEKLSLPDDEEIPEDRLIKYGNKMLEQIPHYADFDEDRDMFINVAHPNFDMKSECDDNILAKEKFQILGCKFNNNPIYVENAEYSYYKGGWWGSANSRRICSGNVSINYLLHQESGCYGCGKDGEDIVNPVLNYQEPDYQFWLSKNMDCEALQQRLYSAEVYDEGFSTLKVEDGKVSKLEGSIVGI